MDTPLSRKHTVLSSCSTVVYKEWLVVAGGRPFLGGLQSSVEVMNIDIKQWHTGPPTCMSWCSMKTAIVGGECYFIGGFAGATPYSATTTNKVYAVSLQNLITFGLGDETDRQMIWKEISRLQTTHSTPLSIGGSLLAFGGMDKDRKAVTAIHVYQPDTGEWVKVGDLPTPRHSCICALLKSNREFEVLVAGGYNSNNTILSTMDIAKLI